MGNFAANEGLSTFVIVSWVFQSSTLRIFLKIFARTFIFMSGVLKKKKSLQRKQFLRGHFADELKMYEKLFCQMLVFFWHFSFVKGSGKNMQFKIDGSRFGCKEVKVVFAGSQLVWLGINAFLFVHFYMAFLVERWFYTRVLLGVSPLHTFESSFVCF